MSWVCGTESSEKQTMRVLMTAAVSLFVIAPGAFAQAADPGRPVAGPAPAVTQDAIVREHPYWFSEAGIPYRPCPCSVVFPGGRHACIGLP
jgi:hypothetical protein